MGGREIYSDRGHLQWCEGRGGAVAASGEEVLQGFQTIGGSYPCVGIAMRWGVATSAVRTAKGRVWKVFISFKTASF